MARQHDIAARALARRSGGARAACVPVLVLAAALAWLAGACGGGDEPRARPKHVVLIVADTLRANRLGCYGYPRPTSPRIDELAARGTLYRHSYSQACWTVPSMISLMTGASVTQPETALPKDFTVLGEALRARGFETAAFLANATLFAERGFERGFDRFETERMAPAPALAERFAAWHAARADASRPFFAWVHFVDPHVPYAPAPEHDVFRGERPDQAERLARWRDSMPRVQELSPGVAFPPVEDAAARMVQSSNAYDGEVLAVDVGVGRILDTLRASGELEETLIVFCADHGEMLFEQELEPFFVQETLARHSGLPQGVLDLYGSGHRAWYFEDLWNTPLVLAGPGFPAGETREGLAANLDIYPTILAALDVAAPATLQGESLWGGRTPERERVFAHSFPSSAVRERSGLKLILQPRQLFLLEDDGPQQAQLFDVAADPSERRELSAARPADVERLRGEIERWRAANARPADTGMTEAQRKALLQMGYAGEVEAAERRAPPRIKVDR